MIGASQLQAALELERIQLLLQASVVAEGIAATFALFCDVAFRDLLDPGNAIIAFDAFSSAISLFSTTNAAPPEFFELGGSALRARIDTFAHERGKTPRVLTPSHRRELVANLRESGHLEVRRSMPMLASHLGISRATHTPTPGKSRRHRLIAAPFRTAPPRKRRSVQELTPTAMKVSAIVF
jgi:predicted transcriptional regulator YheO